MSTPKTLAERMEWMSQNLPGFREELQVSESARQKAVARQRQGRSFVPVQSDFWPELARPDMVVYARISHVGEHADAQRVGAGTAAADVSPLGIYGEIGVTLTKKGRS